MQTPLDFHVKTEFFAIDEHRKVWEMVLDHFSQHGTVPEEDTVLRAYPNYQFVSPPEPMRFYVEALKDAHKFRIVTDTMDRVMDDFDAGGPNPGDRMINQIMKGLADVALAHPPGTSEEIWAGLEDQFDEIKLRKANPGYLRGIATGFPTIDKVTGGFQPEQLITLVSTPKGGKSSFALKCALEASMQGYRVAFFTFEMTAQEQKDRLTSLLTGVGLTDILNGTVSKPELTHIERTFKLHKDRTGFTVFADPASITTVPDIQNIIKQASPHIVVVDGCYLMEDVLGEPNMSPRALTNIVQGLKRVAQAERVPMLCSTQALHARSKHGVESDSVGYTSAFVQSSDVVLGIDRPGETVRKFKVLESRSGPRDHTYVRLDWSTGTIEEIDEAVAEQLADPPTGKGHGGPKVTGI